LPAFPAGSSRGDFGQASLRLSTGGRSLEADDGLLVSVNACCSTVARL